MDYKQTLKHVLLPTALGAILVLGGVFKFEIIARTAELNNTAVESCFVLE